MERQQKASPLPRLFIVSSGEENTDNGLLLLNQLNLLPRSLPCMIQIREKSSRQKNY